ncbi:MAG: serine hydrolase, partial [Myxococcota bacterium]|nr:serine hydrolase [Myxococcota bacterium]
MQRWILTLAMACSPATIDQPAPGKTEADTGTSDTADTDDTDTTDTGEPDDTDELAWPGDEWDEAEPEAHGFDSDLLDEAREYAFVSTHNTQAVVIIKDGVLIAEWYADDTDRDTPVTSWSTAKSFTSALFGVALREKLLELDEPIGDYMPDWSGETHQGITIRHLLEMRSGIEENTANEYGMYGEAYQLAYSLDRTPSWEPGVSFNYVNEDSMVLGGVLSAAFDREVGRVAQDEIFEPLGMEAAWWTDSSGHSLTWCCIDSTARDFARFGLLYARDGEWMGEQLIPSDFVAESTAGISYYGYYG